MQRFFFQLAEQGKLLVLESEFIQGFAAKNNYSRKAFIANSKVGEIEKILD